MNLKQNNFWASVKTCLFLYPYSSIIYTTINGTTFYSVGLRPKGNSSLSMIAGDGYSDRFSFESVEESFTDRNFGSDVGFLYKPESMNMGGAPQDEAVPNIQTDTANEKAATQTHNGQNENKSEGGSALQYIDDAIKYLSRSI